ncbi:nucleoside/nucleotide kinase family protein [Carbonactinospora thermoautotrophica]|nr:hypothetical protein [Carbonactinospora thermoautotrophica]
MGKVERVMLIVVEGPSGVGKTSLAQALPGAVHVSETGASSPAPCLADFTRHHLHCLAPIERFLLYAARTAVKARTAARTLAGGSGIVVVDRFEASLYVLGTVTLRLAPDFVTALLGGHLAHGLTPDLTVFLDCDYRTYRQRAERRGDGLLLDAAGYEQQRKAFRRWFERQEAPSLWVNTSDLPLAELSHKVLANIARCL